MAKEEKKVDDRVDEYARSVFATMGYNPSDLLDELAAIYNSFKKSRDRLNPGRLSSEGFATVVLLFEMSQGSVLPKEG